MPSNRFREAVALFLSASILLIFFGGSTSFSMDILIEPCKSETYLTIDSLYDYCNVPGPCGRKYEIEGKLALVKGLIDYSNIFDRAHYPNLPYQKFLITNHEHNKSMEVWVASECSDLIFNIIFKQKSLNPNSPAFIRGIVVGFDMPIMGNCRRGLKIELTGENSLMFDINSPEF